MKVAFIGMGTMGVGMALNILNGGYPLTVHNRTREKEAPVVAKGALAAGSPAEAAEDADLIITCVSDTPDVEAVLLGENGVIHGAGKGSVVIDMSTISPAATRDMAAALAEKQIDMLDAPVSGGSEGAQKGTLAIMVGGDQTVFDRALPILETMGQTITLLGPIGSGQVTKAINQVIIAATYLGVAEGMALGLKAGLDCKKVARAISGGAAGSWVLDNRAGNMVDNQYPLGFRVRLHHKDLKIALEAARELGVSMPATALVDQVETGLVGRGYGDEDVSAVARTIRELSGIL
ncbi:MAG: NAD(P)-dependent oxidoreductase [Deltaproteobacteria bacterium]|nr:NAD(P)-dependent oxidoreductase [Deltaproteobacteria bacterium]